MTLERILRLRFVSDTGDATDDTKELKENLGDLDAQAKKTSPTMDTLARGLRVGLASAAVAATAAVAFVGKTIWDGIQSSTEREKVDNQLANTFETMGAAAFTTVDKLHAHANALQAATTYGDEEVKSVQNLLLTFGNLQELLPDVTELTLDMATKMGGDASQAALQLGKAFNDPINGLTALTRSGVSFTEQQKEQIKTLQESGDLLGAQSLMFDEINKQFGNSARTAAEGMGRIDQLKNKWDDFLQVIGDVAIPIISQVADKVLPVATEAVDLFAEAVQEFIDSGKMDEWTDWMGDTLILAIDKMVEYAPKAVTAWKAITGEDYGGGEGNVQSSFMKVFEWFNEYFNRTSAAADAHFIMMEALRRGDNEAAEKAAEDQKIALTLLYGETAASAMTASRKFFAEGWVKIEEMMTEWDQWQIDLLAGWITWWSESGGNMINGMLGSMKEMWQGVVSWVTSAFSWLSDQLRKVMNTIDAIKNAVGLGRSYQDELSSGGGGGGGGGFGGNSSTVNNSYNFNVTTTGDGLNYATGMVGALGAFG